MALARCPVVDCSDLAEPRDEEMLVPDRSVLVSNLLRDEDGFWTRRKPKQVLSADLSA